LRLRPHLAQAGCSGGTLAGARRNLYPAFWPVLYQPDKPEGERYTVMRATGIPRMYHGSAALTLDGKVFVSGCDSCQPSVDQFLPYLGSGESFYERNPVGNVSCVVHALPVYTHALTHACMHACKSQTELHVFHTHRKRRLTWQQTLRQ
jgi:hypothetical protein